MGEGETVTPAEEAVNAASANEVPHAPQDDENAGQVAAETPLQETPSQAPL
jgi:hypothetical protein